MLEIEPRSIAAIAVSLAVSSLLAIVLYRRTVPRIPGNYRLLLGCLRWFAILLIMLLVTSPRVTIVRSESREPLVTVLIDQSRSMEYPDTTKISVLRSGRLLKVLRDLSSRAGLSIHGFSDGLTDLTVDEIPSIEPQGARTDIAGAIKASLEGGSRPSALILIGDGSNNYGDDPVYYATHLSVPIYCVATVSKKPTPDIVVERVEASDVAYAGSALKIWVNVSSNLDHEIPTKLSVSDSTGIVHSSQILLPPYGARTRIPVKLEAGDIGIHKFRVRVDPFDGEKVVINNQASFAVRVIKGKMRVCLAASRPSWDFAFARRALKNNPNISVSTFLAKPSHIKLEDGVSDLESALGTLDVLVIFKGTRLEPQYQAIKRYVEQGGALLFVSGEPSQKLFSEFSPFVLGSSKKSQVRLYNPVVTDFGKDHEIMRVGMESPNFSWSKLPPLPVPEFITGKRSGALALLEGRNGSDRIVLLGIMRFASGRIGAFSCFDLWKWDLAPKGFGLGVNAYDALLANLIGWLTEKSEVKPLAVSTSNLVYLEGEPVDISARLLGDDLQPLSGARVSVDITKAQTGEVILTRDMKEKGSGNYSIRVEHLAPGAYVARVSAYLEGNQIVQLVHFDVDERGLEDSDFDGDLAMLERLASSTGGKVIAREKLDDLGRLISPGTIVVKSSKALVLKLNLPTFVLLVVLFGVEWLIRKRKLLV